MHAHGGNHSVAMSCHASYITIGQLSPSNGARDVDVCCIDCWGHASLLPVLCRALPMQDHVATWRSHLAGMIWPSSILIPCKMPGPEHPPCRSERIIPSVYTGEEQLRMTCAAPCLLCRQGTTQRRPDWPQSAMSCTWPLTQHARSALTVQVCDISHVAQRRPLCSHSSAPVILPNADTALQP
jgi:hypothetical protein